MEGGHHILSDSMSGTTFSARGSILLLLMTHNCSIIYRTESQQLDVRLMYHFFFPESPPLNLPDYFLEVNEKEKEIVLADLVS